VKYFQTNFDDDDGFERLKHYLAELDEELGTRGNRLFYLAVAPEYFADIIARLGAHGMAQSGEEADNWVRGRHREAIRNGSRIGKEAQ